LSAGPAKVHSCTKRRRTGKAPDHEREQNQRRGRQSHACNREGEVGGEETRTLNVVAEALCGSFHMAWSTGIGKGGRPQGIPRRGQSGQKSAGISRNAVPRLQAERGLERRTAVFRENLEPSSRQRKGKSEMGGKRSSRNKPEDSCLKGICQRRAGRLQASIMKSPQGVSHSLCSKATV